MRTRLAVACVVTCALPLLAEEPASRAASQAPAFSAAAELVTVDAVVLDEHGQPISGLAREDFVVTENGEERAITQFEAVEESIERQESPVPTAAAPKEEATRSFVIVYDDLHIVPLRGAAARKAVEGFLTRDVREGDQVTVAVTGSGAWWTANIPDGREDLLAFIDGQTGQSAGMGEGLSALEARRIVEYDDRATLDDVVERWVRQSRCEDVCTYMTNCDPRDGRKACEEEVRGTAQRLNSLGMAGIDRTLRTLTDAMAGLGRERGRRSLMLVSEGFLFEPNRPAYREVVQASLRSNTAVYFLDVRGLQASFAINDISQRGDYDDSLRMASEESSYGAAGAELVAEDSGGFAMRNSNDLEAGLGRVARESRSFYLLAYQLGPGKPGFRKVAVRVARPGAQVRARKGYFVDASGRVQVERPGAAVVEAKAKTKGETVRPALGLGAFAAQDDIVLRMQDYGGPVADKGRARVRLLTEVDRRSVGAAEASLALRMDVWPRKGRQWVRCDQPVKVKKGDETQWQAVTCDMALAPGVYQARIQVRDQASGREGATVHRFEVQEPKGLRFATPVLADTLKKSEGGAPKVTATAAREFASGPGRDLFVQFEVFGSRPSRPVSVSVKLVDGAGREVRSIPPGPLEADGEGHVARLVGFKIEDLPTGRYELVLEAQGEKAAEHVTHKQPVSLRLTTN